MNSCELNVLVYSILNRSRKQNTVTSHSVTALFIYRSANKDKELHFPYHIQPNKYFLFYILVPPFFPGAMLYPYE